jgi:hypothetical protein
LPFEEGFQKSIEALRVGKHQARQVAHREFWAVNRPTGNFPGFGRITSGWATNREPMAKIRPEVKKCVIIVLAEHVIL